MFMHPIQRVVWTLPLLLSAAAATDVPWIDLSAGLDLRPAKERASYVAAFLRAEAAHDRSEGREDAAAAREGVAEAVDAIVSGKSRGNAWNQPEVHVVGIYEGTARAGSDDAAGAPKRVAHVLVSRTVAPVILVLSAHEECEWTVELARHVKLARVILSSRKPQSTVGVPSGVPIETIDEWPSAYPESEAVTDVAELLAAVKRHTLRPLRTFIGGYRPDAAEGVPVPFEVGPGNPDWCAAQAESYAPDAVRAALDARRARLDVARYALFGRKESDDEWSLLRVAVDGGVTPVASLAVPIHIVTEGEAGAYFVLSERREEEVSAGGALRFASLGQSLQIIGPDGAVRSLGELEGLPAFDGFSWPGGLAYDTNRERVGLFSYGGDGLFLAYGSDGTWSRIGSLENRDYAGVGFDRDRGEFIALKGRLASGAIRAFDRLDERGAKIAEVALSMPICDDSASGRLAQIRVQDGVAVIVTWVGRFPNAFPLVSSVRLGDGVVLTSTAVRDEAG